MVAIIRNHLCAAISVFRATEGDSEAQVDNDC